MHVDLEEHEHPWMYAPRKHSEQLTKTSHPRMAHTENIFYVHRSMRVC